ncbi:S-adenosyl-L-methionine-dependent methyltransferase [Xylariaceae sp. FL0594]|nr:S-adenosyl-L-methionine-dependent methyltransferase [Xylariaceae sp. FL0594]
MPYFALRLSFRYVKRASIPPLYLVRSCSMATTHSNGPATTVAEVQTFIKDGGEYTEVKEGLARILVPFSRSDASGEPAQSLQEQQSVFYNPIQQFNRDLTVLAIKAYGKEFLSKSRSSNAKHIAKRKRKKSDVGGSGPKRQQEKPTDTAGPADPDPAVTASTPSSELPKCLDSSAANSNAVLSAARDGAEDTEMKEKEHDAITEESPAITTEAQSKQESVPHHPAPNGPPAANAPRFTILDALSATGLRALRYAQELPFVTSVTANDLSASAVEAIRRNAEHNGVASKINATQGDARAHMYSLLAEEASRDPVRDRHSKQGPPKGKRYNVIDLDPYGTAAPFLDAAVNAVREDGGLLCVTCTDSGVWASNGYPEKAFSLYGGLPIKGSYSHEVGLRLVLHAIATTAARYGLAIEPLLSLSIDYYLRIFVKVTRSPAQVKFLAGKTMTVYNCDSGCGAWETQLLARNKKVVNKSGNSSYKHGFALAPAADANCKHCDSKMHLAGPMYAGPLHSPDFVQKVLDELPAASDDIYGTKPRIEGMLQTALEEFDLPSDDGEAKTNEDRYAALEPYPFYFLPTNIAGALHCNCPDEDSLRGALRHLGYEVTRSHCKAGSMKTNAPWSVVWHVMREYIRQKRPVKVEKIAETSPAYKLLRLANPEKRDAEVDNLEVVFDQKLGRDKAKPGLVRYQSNPSENWGPQARAKRH